MKIAQVCPYDIDRPGGVQTHIKDTAAALRELGHQVVIIVPKVVAQHIAGDASSGLDIVRIGRARRIRFGGTGYEISLALGADRRDLRALMREGGFDVVHYHTMWTPFLPLQAFLASRAANVATFHDTAAKTASGSVLRGLFRFLSPRLLARLDAAIAVSEAPMEHLSAARGAVVHIIPPCTDLRRFTAAAQYPRRFEKDRLNILFLGRLEKRKGAILLLEAFHRLCSEGLAIRLLIAGTGEEESALRRFVTENRVPDVVFLGGFVDGETPRLYAESDIVCAPSPYGESFGIVVAEAMASGRPVVAAANAGYRTLLTGEAARFLVEPGDVGALAAGLRALAGDPGLRERLGVWGRQESTRYDCRTVAPRLIAVYEQAVADTKRRAGMQGGGTRV